MIVYEKDVLKDIKKGDIPEKIFLQFHHSFQSIEKIGDINIFDIKKMKGNFWFAARDQRERVRSVRHLSAFSARSFVWWAILDSNHRPSRPAKSSLRSHLGG